MERGVHGELSADEGDLLREGALACGRRRAFVGVFHLYKGGHDLHGDFTSPEAHVNGMQFPGAEGLAALDAGSLRSHARAVAVLRWRHALRATRSRRSAGAGTRRRRSTRSTRRWTCRRFSNAMEWPASASPARCRATRSSSGRSAASSIADGSGDLVVTPPADVAVLPRTIPPALEARARRRHPRPWGPFNNDPRILGDVPVGGELHFTLDPGVDHRRALDDGEPADVRVVRGPHGLWRALDDPVPRDERRLGGKRSGPRRHHDRLRVRHDGRGRRRQRRVRRRDDGSPSSTRVSRGASGATGCAHGTSPGAARAATSSSRTATSR